MTTTTTIRRGASLAIGSALGAVSAAAAFDNGSTLGSTSFMQMAYGVGFVAIVALTWVLPSWVEDFWRSGAYVSSLIAAAGFVLFVVVVICGTMGNAAKHRTSGVAERQALLDAYQRAGQSLSGINVELAAAREAKIFKRTASCGNDTEEASRIFCARFRDLEARRKQAEAILANAPSPADAQAAQLAWIFGHDEATVAKSYPMAISIAVEIGAILMFWLAAKTGSLPQAPQEPLRSAITLEAVTIAPKGKAPVHSLPRASQGQFALPAPDGMRLTARGKLHKGDLLKVKRAVAND